MTVTKDADMLQTLKLMGYLKQIILYIKYNGLNKKLILYQRNNDQNLKYNLILSLMNS